MHALTFRCTLPAEHWCAEGARTFLSTRLLTYWCHLSNINASLWSSRAIERQRRRNILQNRRREDVSLLVFPSGACWFFCLMFRELEDEDEEEEEEEEVDFKVASRLESVLLKICSGHFVVFFAEFFSPSGQRWWTSSSHTRSGCRVWCKTGRVCFMSVVQILNYAYFYALILISKHRVSWYDLFWEIWNVTCRICM